MDIEECEKHLGYLITEIERRLYQKSFDDASFVQLNLEINKFKKSVKDSDLPEQIKAAISELEVKYSVKKVERKSFFTIAFILSLGSYYYLFQQSEKAKRKVYLGDLRHQVNSILYQIRV